MNSWFVLFKNLCHDNVQENFSGGQRTSEWLNQAALSVAEHASSIPMKSSEKFVLLPIVELLTLCIDLIFNVKVSLNSQIPRNISAENSNLERVDFENFLYSNLSNKSNN